MAVKNSLNNNLQNQTQFRLLVGGGTNAEISTIQAGTTGLLLRGITGANPGYDDNVPSDTDFIFTSSTAGENRTVTVENTDNTNSGSFASVRITSGGTSAGDMKLNFNISGGQNWTLGMDNSASDAYIIAASSALGTTNVMSASTAGEINYPLQPAFLAFLTSNVTNKTGDGTVYTQVLTSEGFDQNGDYDGTSTFTAPVSGKYYLACANLLNNLGAGHTGGNTTIVTSNRSFTGKFANYGVIRNSGTQLNTPLAVYADMDAADTAIINVVVSGGTKTVGYNQSSSADLRTWFSGYLLV